MQKILSERVDILEQLGQPSDRLFDEEQMYVYIENYAVTNKMEQTLRALPFAREQHKGQSRDGKEKIPYIYHPLLVTCHALALGLDDDNLISTALLHDVCEDCGVLPGDLPANEAVKTAVSLLTKDASVKTEKGKGEHYGRIKQNPTAFMVKLLDRCNNVSSMTSGFSQKRMIKYIKETETYFYPMMEEGKILYPEYSNQIFLIEYHIKSIVETLKHQLCI